MKANYLSEVLFSEAFGAVMLIIINFYQMKIDYGTTREYGNTGKNIEIH